LYLVKLDKKNIKLKSDLPAEITFDSLWTVG